MSNDHTSFEKELTNYIDKSSYFIKQLTNNLTEVLYVVELEGPDIVYVNKSVQEVLGAEPETLLKSDKNVFNELVHPDDLRTYLSNLESCANLADDEVNEAEFRLKANGEWQWFFIRNIPFKRCEENKVTHTIGLAHNIDEMKTAQKELTRLKERITEEKLRVSDEKYHALFNAIDEGFCIVNMFFDENGKAIDYLIEETNPEYERLTGLYNSVGKRVSEVAPGLEDHWFEKYGSVAKTGKPLRFVHEARTLAGGRWFDVYAFPAEGSGSNKVAILFDDITSIRKAELELKQLNEELEKRVAERTKELEEVNRQLQLSNDKLNAIFESSAVMLTFLKPVFEPSGNVSDYILESINESNIKGSKLPDDAKGKLMSSLLPGIKKHELWHVMEKVLKTGEMQRLEYFYGFENVNEWYDSAVVKLNDGLLIGSLITTEHKKAEEEIRENANFIKNITETIPGLIVIYDVERKMLDYLNHDLSLVIGFSTNELLKMSFGELLAFVHPEDIEPLMNHLKSMDAIKDIDIAEIEIRVRKKEGEWLWFSNRSRVFKRNRSGKPTQILAVLTDITQNKKTQEDLIQAEKHSLKGDLAHTIAHEVRNPLANIRLTLDIMQKELEGKPEFGAAMKPLLDIISQSSHKVDNLIKDLLQGPEENAEKKTQVDLAIILEDTLQQANDRIYLTGVKIEKDFSKGLKIMANEEKLKVAFLNIIVNAIEAMEPSRGVLQIKASETQNYYKVTIRDNGSGIPQNEIQEIFKPYYTKKKNGLGVGLANVKLILDEHKAVTEVTSAPGEGTFFNIVFRKSE